MLDFATLFALGHNIFWRFIRWIWCLVLTIKWRWDGVTSSVEVKRYPDMYHSSAHVTDIVARYCFDKILTRNSRSDFLVTHKEFVHPRYVLSDECSLYSINDNEVLFVEAPSGVDVSSLEFGAFHRLAQFNQAIRLVSMPLYAFQRLAEEVGAPQSKIIFLEYLPRTGSTMLCKMFESTQRCVAISEPDIFLDYVSYHSDEDQLLRNLSSGLRLLCKPRQHGVQPLAFILKVAPCKPAMFNNLSKEFNSSQLFIYRAPIKSVCSLLRVSNLSPTMRFGKLITQLFPSMKSKLIPRMSGRGVDTSAAVEIIMKSKHFEALSNYLLWLGLLRGYQNQVMDESSPDIPAVKYEHIIKNPQASIETIFRHVGLPGDLVTLALTGMLDDSQKNSIVNRKNASKFAVLPTPEGELAEDLLAMSVLFGLEGYSDEVLLPNTITSL